MPITREEWDNIEEGDTLKLQGYAFGLATFKVDYVESYQRPDKTTHIYTALNKRHESVTWGHYQVQNPKSFIIKRETT